LSREDILPCEKSANSAGQKVSSPHKATHRKARVYGASGQDSPQTIIYTLARHVDLAPVAKRIGESTAGL